MIGESRYFTLMIIGFMILSLFPFSSSGTAGRSWIEVHDAQIDVSISNSYSTVKVDFEMENTGSFDAETELRITIPSDAFFTNLTIVYGEQMFYGIVKESEEAEHEYEEAVEEGKSAIKLEKLSTTDFLMSINLEKGKSMDISYRYAEFLVRELGGFELRLSPKDLFPAETDQNVHLSVKVNTQSMVTKASVVGPDDGEIEYHGATGFSSTMQISPSDLDGDVKIIFENEDTDTSGSMLFHDEGELTYFLHTFAPGTGQLGSKGLDKDIVFVVDHSGSMAGDKIKDTKAAFDVIIDQMDPVKDRFNIISFSSDVELWKTELQQPNATTVKQAKKFIGDLEATGGTNIIDSLIEGLDVFDSKSGCMKVIVFLTDGNPTSGNITAPNSICIKANEKNVNKISIFSLGIGNDVDFAFLEKLSFLNYARAYKIEEHGDISEQISHFYDTISTPLIYRLNLAYDNAESVYQRHAPYLFQGQEHCVVGKVTDPARTLEFSGTGVTVNDTETFSGEFTPNSGVNPFIPRLWAFMHIRWCEEKMLIEDDPDTYEEELLHTALEFQIVTDYTTMILVAEEDYEEEKEEAGDDDDDDSDDDGTPPPDADDDYTYDPSGGGSGDSDGGGYHRYDPDDTGGGDGKSENSEYGGVPEFTNLIIPAFTVVMIIYLVRRQRNR